MLWQKRRVLRLCLPDYASMCSLCSMQLAGMRERERRAAKRAMERGLPIPATRGGDGREESDGEEDSDEESDFEEGEEEEEEEEEKEMGETGAAAVPAAVDRGEETEEESEEGSES